MFKLVMIVLFTLDILFAQFATSNNFDKNITEKNYIPELKLISVEYVDELLLGPNLSFKFRKLNRTHFALNVEFELLKDLDANKMVTKTELYLLLNDYYKSTGVRVTVNQCQSWKQNAYSIRDILQKYSNIDACNVVKKRYWVKDFILDTSMYPTNIPLGSYKAVIITELDGVNILQLAYHLKLNYYANWKKQSENRLKIRVL